EDTPDHLLDRMIIVHVNLRELLDDCFIAGVAVVQRKHEECKQLFHEKPRRCGPRRNDSDNVSAVQVRWREPENRLRTVIMLACIEGKSPGIALLRVEHEASPDYRNTPAGKRFCDGLDIILGVVRGTRTGQAHAE